MKAVADAARAWVGRAFHPGQTEQCMAFVRAILAEAKAPVAEVVTHQPVDGLDTSFFLASSLAGRDVGRLVDKVQDLTPGSVVFFENTYGNWPAGTITHVGIYIGDGQLVHRPTASKPVQQEDFFPGSYWSGFFRCGLLIPDAAPAIPPPKERRLKVFAHDGKLAVISDGKVQTAAQVAIDVHDGKLGVRIGGQPIAASSLEFEVVYK